jgi:DNA-binding transcriptional MerR regulator
MIAPTQLEDAELLDVVRRLRSYMITIDNVHHVLGQSQLMDDDTIKQQSASLLVDAPELNTRVSALLRSIEASKQYRSMVKKYNLTEEMDEED